MSLLHEVRRSTGRGFELASGLSSKTPRTRMSLSAPQRHAINGVLDALQAAQAQRIEGKSGQVHAMLRAIHAQLLKPGLTVKEIKASAGITDNNIACRFRYEMGMTIKRYIDTCRLEIACELLKKEELNVTEVARLVGYAHPQTFYAVFIRERNCSPGAVRCTGPTRTPASSIIEATRVDGAERPSSVA